MNFEPIGLTETPIRSKQLSGKRSSIVRTKVKNKPSFLCDRIRFLAWKRFPKSGYYKGFK